MNAAGARRITRGNDAAGIVAFPTDTRRDARLTTVSL